MPRTYSEEVLADSPVVWLRMSEVSGNPQDSSGNANHVSSASGTTPTYGAQGALLGEPHNKAIAFNNSGYFQVPDNATLDLGDTWTIECWLYLTTIGVDQAICDKGTNSFKLYITALNTVTLEKSGVADSMRASGFSTANVWRHLVVKKAGATGQIYFDGSGRDPTVSQTIENTAVDLFVGAQADAGIPFRGVIDEFALYSTALSDARVQAHYQAGLDAGMAQPRRGVAGVS